MLRSAVFYLILLGLSVAPSGLAHRTHRRRHSGHTGDRGEKCTPTWDSVGNATKICGSFTTSTIPSSPYFTPISATDNAKSASTSSSSPAVFKTLVASRSPASSTTLPAASSSPDIGSEIDSIIPLNDEQAYLDDHNEYRAKHEALPLSWNSTLAMSAQQWADRCQFIHSGGPYGENLAAGTGPTYDIAQAITSWTDESSEYDPINPQGSHFTQIVWKSTLELGCAFQVCGDIFPAEYGPAKFFVCEYQPRGNVIGEFSENVQP